MIEKLPWKFDFYIIFEKDLNLNHSRFYSVSLLRRPGMQGAATRSAVILASLKPYEVNEKLDPLLLAANNKDSRLRKSTESESAGPAYVKNSSVMFIAVSSPITSKLNIDETSNGTTRLYRDY